MIKNVRKGEEIFATKGLFICSVRELEILIELLWDNGA